ncbi:biliverdin-producing heme oxygenase [Nocardioides aquiterrae]|uniref:Biliverdin-producing heme oxygenase n=1 Tax=Nocardioides aquiterrae TaxID=203799 RepID=A0ABN1UB97_9ACTN
MSTSLSAAMRLGSRAEHEQAEEAPFVTDLLAGRVGEQGYAEYLLRLRAVYDALEGAVRAHADDPAVAAVHDPDLERVPALDADLDHWLPDGPRTVASPAVTAYRERLEHARAWGPLLAAHHYTRYLGDLSGGQAIGRVVDRTFGLAGRGVAFYDFPAIPRPKPYKDAYRARLDALGLSPVQTARVVDEVRAAFRLNHGLFAELVDSLPA